MSDKFYNFGYIFIDDSNLIHEGSSELGVNEINVDYNRLVIKVLNGKPLGKVFIVGSTPTSEHRKKSWERAKKLGFNVQTYPRNHLNKEKKVDTQLTCDIMRTILKDPGSPSNLVLVAGDSDYYVPLNEAIKEKWDVETWFWPKGMSSDFKNSPYASLKTHYKSFVYIVGHDSKRLTLKVSGDTVESWKRNYEPIMECFCALGLLCRLNWVDDKTVHLYFDDEGGLKLAKNWLIKKYPLLSLEQERELAHQLINGSSNPF